MKKLLMILMMALLALGLYSGCIFDSGSSDDGGDDGGDGGGGGGTAAEYFPITSPGTWTFEEVDSEAGQPTETKTSVVYTNGTITLDGKTYVILSDDSGEGDMYFRIADNIIYMYDEEMDFITKDAVQKAAALAGIEAADVPWINFGAGQGNSWTMYENSGSEGGYSYSFSQKGKYLGTETVTATAGTYKNCMKFEMTVESSYSGGGMSGSYLYTETYWFAKNVGPVKIMSVDTENGIVTSSSSSNLKSYKKEAYDGGNNGGGGDAGTHAFFPLRDNAMWTYAEVEKDLTDNSTYNTSYTSSIDGTIVIGGKTYWVMVSDDGDPDDYVRIADGIVYSFVPQDFLAFKGAPENVPAAMKQAMAEDLTDEVPVINLNVSSGSSWTILNYTVNQQGVDVTISWTGKYIGTENVSVQAGSFNGCRKYEMNISATTQYAGVNYVYSTKSTMWLAQNVGMVRIYDLDSLNGINVHDYDQKLTSYSIP